MKELRQEYLTGERALFQGRDLKIYGTTFADGESPLKESANIDLHDCLFEWKYPLWYGRNISVRNCTLFATARAGVWYTDDIAFEDCVIESPKNFRRCRGVQLKHITISSAQAALRSGRQVPVENVTANGDYFAMNSEDIEADGFTLTGNYAFDGAKNVVIRNAKMLTRDAFWNSENVTVYDSHIYGEYLGWNAKNLTLVNCTVESLQGMCYAENLVMENCRLLNTTLAFEYSSVRADILGRVDSVKNPVSGKIVADDFGEIIVESDKVDPAATTIARRGEGRE